MAIGDYIKKNQPAVYALLMSWVCIMKTKDSDKAYREIERLMRHDAYTREHGAIRQIRRV